MRACVRACVRVCDTQCQSSESETRATVYRVQYASVIMGGDIDIV